MRTRAHELAELATILEACCDFLTRHPTRTGAEYDAALADLRGTVARLNAVAHAYVDEEHERTSKVPVKTPKPQGGR